MHFILLYLLIIEFKGFNSLGKSDHDDITSVCSNRFEYRFKLKNQFNNCSRVIQLNPACGENITVAYQTHPPYVHQKNGSIIGILPAMLNFALDSCCFGCQNIHYIGPFDGMDKFYQHTTLVLPIQTSIRTKKFFGHDFVHMFAIKAVNVVGPEIHIEPDKIIQIIVGAVCSTWPLFVIAALMALAAGVTIWVLDSSSNQAEFPNDFPRGPFEGLWWAVVSMTTVGYGDRSPRSVPARLFAIVWILIGITIFSIYSATLTTSLTTAIIASRDISLFEKTFAVLNTTSIGTIATMKQRASSKGYSTIAEIKNAIEEMKVHGMALDENVANYYADHLSEDKDKYKLYQRLLVTGSSYGVLSYNELLTKTLTSFYDSNDDQRDIMAMLGMGEHAFDQGFEEAKLDTLIFFGSHEMLSITLLALSIITTILVLIGLLLRWKKTKKGKDQGLPYLSKELLKGDVQKMKHNEHVNHNSHLPNIVTYVSAL